MKLKNTKLLYGLIVVVTFIININSIKATVEGSYNGGGSMSAPGNGHGACPSNTSNSNLCFYNNGNHVTIRLTLVKYQDGKRTQVGHSIYYTFSDAKYTINEVNATNINGSPVKESNLEKNNRVYTGSWYRDGYKLSPTKMQGYLYKDGEIVRENAINVLKKITTNKHFQSKKALSDYLSDLRLDGDMREFRLVIEPVFSFSNGKSIVYYTAKAIAKSGKSITRSGRWCEIGSKLYTEYKDIGIAKGSYQGTVDNCSSYNNTKKMLANHTNGTGYNIASFYDEKQIQKLIPLVCDYNKKDHFKKNLAGEKKPTDKIGSGPTGENCCNLKVIGANGKTNLDIYKAQYKKEEGKNPTTKQLKDFFYHLHPECIESDHDTNPPLEIKGSCYGSGETGYDQNASEYDLLAAIGQDRGQTNVNGSTSKYIRQNLGRGQISCSEAVKLSLPINYQNKLYRGSILEWPTYNSGLRLNTYPLNMEGKASCILNIDYAGIVEDNTIHKLCKSCSGFGVFRFCGYYDCPRIDWKGVKADVKAIKDSAMDWKKNPQNHYDLKGNFYVEYNDKKYGGTFPLVRYFNGHKNYKTTGFSFGNTGGSFTISQQVKYKINPNQYRYILKLNKQETRSVDILPDGIGKNYIDVGYGNLPIANDAKKGKYDISIKYDNIGGFSNYKFSPTSTLYKCSYEVDVDTPIPEYLCPTNDDTISACTDGMDLVPYMSGGIDGKKYTYQEAVEKFCYSKTPPCECPEGTENCGMDLSSYTATGMSCSQAQSKYCNSTNPFPNPCPSGTDFEGLYILTDKCNSDYNCRMLTCNQYVCPEHTKKAGMNCDVLVADYIARNGGTINGTLLNKLYKKFCGGNDNSNNPNNPNNPGNGNNGNRGVNIIYRVIELDNPFPGKSGNGREPGYNWNDVKIKKNYITNNRNVKTNKVYNKANAMYHFKLTTSVIKTIRAYNSNNDYSDFKLTCKASSGRECISDFVHNSSYGLVGDSKCFANGSFNKCRN